VVFDLGGVIVTNMEPALRDLMDHHGGDGAMSATELNAVWWPLYRDATLGLLHPDELWRAFRAQVALHGLPHGGEDQALLSRIQLREPSIPQTIKALKASYRVGLLSNYVERWATALMTGFGVISLFDAVVISSEVGVRKPDTGIYRQACEALGVPPSRAAYIGDEEEDMVGAQAVGMLPIFIPGQDLSSIGMLIDRVADVLPLLNSSAAA
jgi:putative hydrolase of the HAD superfamily